MSIVIHSMAYHYTVFVKVIYIGFKSPHGYGPLRDTDVHTPPRSNGFNQRCWSTYKSALNGQSYSLIQYSLKPNKLASKYWTLSTNKQQNTVQKSFRRLLDHVYRRGTLPVDLLNKMIRFFKDRWSVPLTMIREITIGLINETSMVQRHSNPSNIHVLTLLLIRMVYCFFLIVKTIQKQKQLYRVNHGRRYCPSRHPWRQDEQHRVSTKGWITLYLISLCTRVITTRRPLTVMSTTLEARIRCISVRRAIKSHSRSLTSTRGMSLKRYRSISDGATLK